MKKIFKRTSLLLATALNRWHRHRAGADIFAGTWYCFIDALMRRMTVEEKIGQNACP